MTSTEVAISSRVERTAGRNPGPLSPAPDVTAHMLHFSRRHAQILQRAPPPRTPPSIPLPTPRPKTKGRPPQKGLIGLEFSSRTWNSKRHGSLLRHFKEPLGRSTDSLKDSSTAPSPITLSMMGSLQVCPLNGPPLSRQPSLPSIFSDFSFNHENLAAVLKQPTDLSLLNIDEENATDASQLDKMVTFCHPAPLTFMPPSRKTTTAPGQTGLCPERAGSVPLPRQPTSLQTTRSVTSLPAGRKSLLPEVSQSTAGLGPQSLGPVSSTTINLARTGRPIAHFAFIPDPGEAALAAQVQKEAAAAVDIQRIFRGYVARNAYRKLLSDVRKKMEAKQRAAMEIQRAYRRHLGRKHTIERRPYNPKMVQWVQKYRTTLASRLQRRKKKEEDRAEELSDNYYNAQAKLSVIGPHVNIYEIYHPKKTGPTRKELNHAATTIQRHVRGWLVRRRFDKLHRKAAWYGSTFSKMLKEYKAMLMRIQRQYGVEHPQTPFTTKDMNDYIDTRRRYETVFEKKAFGGELEAGDLDSYFKECDLYPSQAEIAKAMEVTFKDQSVSRHSRGFKRAEILDILFYIYTPKATGLENTRQSTWLNPIIDGVEARRLLGSEFVEEAPLEVCAQLVISTMRERHEKERAVIKARKEQEAAELRTRLGLPHPKDDDEEDEKEERRRQRKLRRVTVAEPAVKDRQQQAHKPHDKKTQQDDRPRP